MKISLFSKAAHSTWIHFPEYKLLMDCGEGCATQLGINTVASIRTIILSHDHSDHLLGLPNLLKLRARHDPNKLPVLNIYIPNTNCFERLISFIEAENSRGHNEYINWIRFDPKDNESFKTSNKNIELQVFPTDHSYYSCGINLIEKRKKLKEEYKHLSSVELGRMRLDGVQIDEVNNKTLLTYTGDTPPIKDCSVFKNPNILITDCTYLDPADNNENYKHCTLDDAYAMFRMSAANKMIGIHLSARYNSEYLKRPELQWAGQVIQLADPDKINTFNF